MYFLSKLEALCNKLAVIGSDVYRQLSNDLTFWVIWALSGADTSRVKSFGVPGKGSNSRGSMMSVSSVSVAVRIVRACLR